MSQIDKTINIFKFASAAEYLKVVGLQFMSRKNRPFTMEQWAERIGYKSHRSVGMVLNGERLPSREMVDKLSDDLNLDTKERRYLSLLVKLEKSKRAGKNVRPLIVELEELNPQLTAQLPVDSATFAYIAEWYHLVLKQLVSTPQFREDADWIVERLRHKVSTAEVADALIVLQKLGMIERVEGKLKVAPKSAHVKTQADIGNKALKLHHEQMMKRAVESMSEQESLDREITSVTFKFNRERLDEAKQFIRKLRDDFHKKFESHDADAIYQLNLQFFSHTA